MAKMTKESIGTFLKEKYGDQAANGFLSWAEGSEWNGRIAKFTEDYKAFQAKGGTAKDLTVDQIYDYLCKNVDQHTADLFRKYVSRKDMLAQAKAMSPPKEMLGNLKGYISKYAGL